MSRLQTEPKTTLVIVIGASDFPGARELSNPRFAQSALEIYNYFCDPSGFSLPPGNCLWLFDTDEPPTSVYQRIEKFLDQTTTRPEPERPRDIIVYYVGHGFFRDDDRAYFLAAKSLKKDAPEFSYRFRDLQRTVKQKTRALRKFYVIDACFSGAAMKDLMGINAVSEKLIAEAKQGAVDDLPDTGTALLCAASADDTACAPKPENYTMFTGALIDVLNTAPVFPRLTLEQLHRRCASLIFDRFGDSGVRPQIYKPDQNSGDIANIPLFPGRLASARTSIQKPSSGKHHLATEEAHSDPTNKTDGGIGLLDAESQQWLSIKGELDPNVFESFLTKHPQGNFAAQAAERVSKYIGACNDTLPLARLVADFPQSPRRAQVESQLLFLLSRNLPKPNKEQDTEAEEEPRAIMDALRYDVAWGRILGMAILAALGMLSYFALGLLGIVIFVVLFTLVLFLPRTYQISELLTLAERDLNSCLRAWGGGMSADARKAVAEERIRLAQLVGTPEAMQQAHLMNTSDRITGGPQGTAMGSARFTAFLLRELYEGKVRNAQLKVYNDVKNGGKPYIAPGIWQIIGYDVFDPHDVRNEGFPEWAGVDRFPLWLAVKLHRHPRNIIMVKPDKTVVENAAVIDELNRQLRPAAM